MDVLLVLAVVVAVVLLIAAPLRATHDAGEEEEEGPAARRADLEAAKEAKYREIRDAELDHRTGKLAREDWEGLDATLRGEALEILRQLDALEAETR